MEAAAAAAAVVLVAMGKEGRRGCVRLRVCAAALRGVRVTPTLAPLAAAGDNSSDNNNNNNNKQS